MVVRDLRAILRGTLIDAGKRVESTSQAEFAGSIPVIGSNDNQGSRTSVQLAAPYPDPTRYAAQPSALCLMGPWSSGGADLHWCCTGDPATHVGKTQV